MIKKFTFVCFNKETEKKMTNIQEFYILKPLETVVPDLPYG